MKRAMSGGFTHVLRLSVVVFTFAVFTNITLCNDVKAQVATGDMLNTILGNIKLIQEDFEGNMCTWFDYEKGETLLRMNQLKWRVTNAVREVEHKLGIANKMQTSPLSDEAGIALLSADLAVAIAGMGPYAVPLFVAEGFVFATEIGPWLGTQILEYWFNESYEVTIGAKEETLTAKDILTLLENLLPKLEKSLCCQCGLRGPETTLTFCDLTFAPRQTWEELNTKERRAWWSRWWRENCISARAAAPLQ